jgi:hypothetical protein
MVVVYCFVDSLYGHFSCIIHAFRLEVVRLEMKRMLNSTQNVPIFFVNLHVTSSFERCSFTYFHLCEI